ncbi:MAG: LysE family transporter [Bacteroidetes bacterium]|nr:LysE family transporter [Bacteroidota bacterium]
MIVALLIGPVFFLIINTSLHRGFNYAAQVATGVMLSDALFIFVAYFGSNIVLVINNHRDVAGIVASLIILIFGIGIVVKKQTIPAEAIQVNEKVKGAWLFIAKGFMLNSMNPSVLFFGLVFRALLVLNLIILLHTCLYFMV